MNQNDDLLQSIEANLGRPSSIDRWAKESNELNIKFLCRDLNQSKSGWYELPCGHIRRIELIAVRQRKKIGCVDCFNERCKKEAEQYNCELLHRAPDDSKSAYYLLPCKHEKRVRISHMRNGNFRCEKCLFEKRKEESQSYNAIFLHMDSYDNKKGVYKLSCGHVRSIQTAFMRNGNFRCEECQRMSWEEQAKQVGLVFLRVADKRGYGWYRFPCNHENMIQYGNIKNKMFECKKCKKDTWESEAIENGFEFLNNLNKNFSLYRCLNCSHEFKAQMTNIRRDLVRCSKCDEKKSHKQKIIETYIKEKGYLHIRNEVTFNDLIGVGGRFLRYDISFFDLEDSEIPKWIIEYDGAQHYYPATFGGRDRETALKFLEITKEHDRLKNEYAKSKKIPLLRIAHSDIEWKKKIDVFLNSVAREYPM